MNWYTEIIAAYDSEVAAREAYPGVALLDGCVGARLLRAGGGKPWRVQAFFPDRGEAGPYGEGEARRWVPFSVLEKWTCVDRLGKDSEPGDSTRAGDEARGDTKAGSANPLDAFPLSESEGEAI